MKNQSSTRYQLPNPLTQPFNLNIPLLQRVKDTEDPFSPLTHAPDISRRQSVLSQLSKQESDQLLFNSLFVGLFPAEQLYRITASKLYMVLACILLYMVLWLKNTYLLDLSNIQVGFTGVLIACFMNCLLVRLFATQSNFPNRYDPILLKKTMALLVGLVVFYLHGSQYLQVSLASAILYSAFFIVILLEAALFGKDYSIYEILLGIVAYIGIIFTLLGANLTYNETRKIYTLYGMLVISLSALCLAGVLLALNKTQDQDFGKLNQSAGFVLFGLMPFTFLSGYFAIPTFFQSLILFAIGLISMLGILLMIRSIQLEGVGKTSLYIFFQIIFGGLSRRFFTPETNMSFWGTIVALVCLITHALVTGTEKKPEKNKEVILMTVTSLEMIELHSRYQCKRKAMLTVKVLNGM